MLKQWIAPAALVALVVCVTACADDGGSTGSRDSSDSSRRDGGGDLGISEGGSPSCVALGDSCSLPDSPCCGEGVTALCAHDSASPGFDSCVQICTTNSDCSSNCCAKVQDSALKVCGPASFCTSSCVPAGGSCASNINACCSDSVCVVNNSTNTCAAKCKDKSECTSKCCTQLSNSPDKVCSPPSFCP